MAAKKKSTKKQAKSRKSATPKKKMARKKSPVKKVAQKRAKAKARGRKRAVARTVVPRKKQIRKRKQTTSRPFSREAREANLGGQSGDLQGLSNVERADSESVDELLEEGNAFEADVVEGVERAGDADGEVHTHEVPEDDVPEEYRDEE
jgi:hypothetical protein